jgi:RNA polymerase sigma factor (TIGR02999 family)
MSEVTEILNAIERSEPHAADQLLPLVYDELRRLASQKMQAESAGHTLSGTALVHEAYIRLVKTEDTADFNSRGHFFGAAAQAMRRILIDNARRKTRVKHGGDQKRQRLTGLNLAAPSTPEELLAIDEALAAFEQKDPTKAELVKLRFYVGLSVEQAAEVLEISTSTADRYWSYARAWLYRELTRDESDPSD